MIYFSADHHFGHKKVLEYCNRPWKTIEEMDKALIDNWNEVVGKDDIVYYLGDFTLGNWDIAKIYSSQLNGSIHFIPGGHDWRWIGFIPEKGKGTQWDRYPSLYTMRLLNNTIIVLCHYAMRVWDRKHYGSLHLYGHSHGNLEGIGRSRDIGVDTNNYYPVSIEEVLKLKEKDYV